MDDCGTDFTNLFILISKIQFKEVFENSLNEDDFG